MHSHGRSSHFIDSYGWSSLHAFIWKVITLYAFIWKVITACIHMKGHPNTCIHVEGHHTTCIHMEGHHTSWIHVEGHHSACILKEGHHYMHSCVWSSHYMHSYRRSSHFMHSYGRSSLHAFIHREGQPTCTCPFKRNVTLHTFIRKVKCTHTFIWSSYIDKIMHELIRKVITLQACIRKKGHRCTCIHKESSLPTYACMCS